MREVISGERAVTNDRGELGIVRLVRRLLINAPLSMLVTERGIVTLVRALVSKARMPIIVTERGIVTLMRELWSNA